MQPPGSVQPAVLESIRDFMRAAKTGHITLQVKDGRIMQVEMTEVKRVT